MEENKYLVKFRKPYQFEGQEYMEIDLSGLESLTTQDLVEADKVFVQTGNVAAMNEMSVGYSCIVAAKATGKPIEFFSRMPAKDGIEIKNMVAHFFYE